MLVCMLVAVEIIVRIAAHAGYATIRNFETKNQVEPVTFLGDIDSRFGVWHKANAAVTVDTPQGPVTYETNAQGMRDRPRAEKSTAAERVVVLGDSFIEGSYVEESDRITDVLEKTTGVEFLNFGTSGNFGSIQEWLLYEHLAKNFDHSRVCVFLLPANDFTDNDPAMNPPARYRPYLQETAGTYKVSYPVAFAPATTGMSRTMSPGRIFRHMLYNHWYSLNLIVLRDISEVVDLFRRTTITSSYDTYTPVDLSRMLFTYRQILDIAGHRPVHIVVIPRDSDFLAHRAGRFEGKITAALSAFAKEYPGLDVIDLLPYFLNYAKTHGISYKRFFLEHDAHWSPLGHRVAAKAVLEALETRQFKAQATWPAGG